MDIQETIDSLRRVLESVIAPGVESLRLRLDALERDLQENGQNIDRLGGRNVLPKSSGFGLDSVRVG